MAGDQGGIPLLADWLCLCRDRLSWITGRVGVLMKGETTNVPGNLPHA